MGKLASLDIEVGGTVPLALIGDGAVGLGVHVDVVLGLLTVAGQRNDAVGDGVGTLLRANLAAAEAVEYQLVTRAACRLVAAGLLALLDEVRRAAVIGVLEQLLALLHNEARCRSVAERFSVGELHVNLGELVALALEEVVCGARRRLDLEQVLAAACVAGRDEARKVVLAHDVEADVVRHILEQVAYPCDGHLIVVTARQTVELARCCVVCELLGRLVVANHALEVELVCVGGLHRECGVRLNLGLERRGVVALQLAELGRVDEEALVVADQCLAYEVVLLARFDGHGEELGRHDERPVAVEVPAVVLENRLVFVVGAGALADDGYRVVVAQVDLIGELYDLIVETAVHLVAVLVEHGVAVVVLYQGVEHVDVGVIVAFKRDVVVLGSGGNVQRYVVSRHREGVVEGVGLGIRGDERAGLLVIVDRNDFHAFGRNNAQGNFVAGFGRFSHGDLIVFGRRNRDGEAWCRTLGVVLRASCCACEQGAHQQKLEKWVFHKRYLRGLNNCGGLNGPSVRPLSLGYSMLVGL